MPTAAELLDAWLAARLPASALERLRTDVSGAATSGADSDFLLAWSSAPRRFGKADLALTEAERHAASTVHPGFVADHWTVEQAARTRLLLAAPARDAASYGAFLDGLLADGDIGEQVALHQALALLPFPASHRLRTAEGIRTNVKPVFEAIALRNPYPAEQLDEAAWNQLVLKCLFVGSPLRHVVGLDSRVNATLGRMLLDYARERRAAGRPVPLELWRCAAPVLAGTELGELERLLVSGTDAERAAVALGAAKNPAAGALLATHRAAVEAALARHPSWDALAS